MKILMVCPTAPVPAETGGKIRMFNAAQTLVEQDEITLGIHTYTVGIIATTPTQ